MIIGVTGTQRGCTRPQLVQLLTEVKGASTVHHGDCIGVDQQAHHIARQLDIAVVVHPPTVDTKRAWTVGGTVLDPKPYIKRNHDIVDACDQLIAVPKQSQEWQRSGTWATVRYARKVGKPITVIWPDGRVTKEDT